MNITFQLKQQVGQGALITFDNSRYPRTKWNKPERGAFRSATGVVKRFFEIMDTKPPVTAEDAARAARGWPEGSSVYGDFDHDFSEWVSKGPFWLRKTEGQHPKCHPTDRKNAAARWRNAKDSYSCAGYPTFYPETIERFKAEMELIKPLLKFSTERGDVVLSLARTLEGAVGTCWGIYTCETMIHIEVSDQQTLVPYTKAALMRAMKELFKSV